MIRGLLIHRSFWTLIILLCFVWIPTALYKTMGISSAFVDPFVAFVFTIFALSIWVYPLLRPHWISIFIIGGLVAVSFGYVYIFLMI